MRWIYRVERQSFDPSKVFVNSVWVEEYHRVENPYRDGGLSIAADVFDVLLDKKGNTVEIYL